MAVVAAGIVKNRQTSRRSPQRRCISFCPRRPPESELFRWIFLFQKYFIPPVAFFAQSFIVRFA
jgi:hypothetical protein